MAKKLLFLLCLSISSLVSANQLKPFVTDNCTLFADGTIVNPTLWKQCCIEHDMHYWYGGIEKNLNQADLNLKSCVSTVAGNYWATLVYSGVRLGHYSPMKIEHRWGWGWEVKRENSEFSALEKSYILDELRRLPYSSHMIEHYILNNF